jgi:hypothetical protein
LRPEKLDYGIRELAGSVELVSRAATMASLRGALSS